MIEYQYNRINYKLNEQETTDWLEKVVERENSTLGDVGYVFCDDEFLLGINHEFLQHDTFTDIITFSNSEVDGIISGEIYISLERVKENSIVLKTNFNKEMHRVIVHGILHLLGYKDKEKMDELLMRQKEDFYLSLIY